MTVAYTTFDEHYEDFRCNHRLVFGRAAFRQVIEDRKGCTRARLYFEPDAIFAVDLWEPTRIGRTKHWRTLILRAGRPGEQLHEFPQIAPAADPLIQARGAVRCKHLLAWVAELKRKGIEPSLMPADFYKGRELWFLSTPIKRGQTVPLHHVLDASV